MAVRDDFAAGEVLAAADLNDTFAEKLPYSYGTATPSTTDSGFLWYDSNSTPAAPKFWDGSAFVPFGGKILQIVRATDGTARTTTSGTYTDASISVTITPTNSTSALVIVWTSYASPAFGSNNTQAQQITDNSNNAISGAEGIDTGSATSATGYSAMTLIAYATPATTSAVTYKGRYRTTGVGSTARLQNNITTGQMLALEIGA